MAKIYDVGHPLVTVCNFGAHVFTIDYKQRPVQIRNY